MATFDTLACVVLAAILLKALQLVLGHGNHIHETNQIRDDEKTEKLVKKRNHQVRKKHRGAGRGNLAAQSRRSK